MADVVVVVRAPKDAKDAKDNEKPDDYDRKSRPLRALKRVFFLLPRLLKRAVVALWARLVGSRDTPSRDARE